MPVTYYDNSTKYDSGFVADIPTASILGVPRLRQLRIKKGNSRKPLDVLGVCSESRVSTRLPSMWLGFKLRLDTMRHKKFDGSLLCSEKIFLPLHPTLR